MQTKTPLSKILLSEEYAIKVTSVAQAKKLVPHFKNMEDLELFFQVDRRHSEFVGSAHYGGGAGFYFINPHDKKIIDYEQVEFDI